MDGLRVLREGGRQCSGPFFDGYAELAGAAVLPLALPTAISHLVKRRQGQPPRRFFTR
jgi:hypothetical protein